MTNYDPYAYGEVRLDPNKQRAPIQDQEDDDDPLYGTASRPVIETSQEPEQPPVDASWALLGEDVQDLLPGADVAAEPDPLDELAPAPPAPAPQQAAPASQRVSSKAQPQRTIDRQPLSQFVGDDGVRARPARRRAVGVPRRTSAVVAAVLPAMLCSGGAAASWWFWQTQENPVMAAILGAAAVVSALFAWLLLRG